MIVNINKKSMSKSIESNLPQGEHESEEEFDKFVQNLKTKSLEQLEAEADYVEGRLVLGKHHSALLDEIKRRKENEGSLIKESPKD